MESVELIKKLTSTFGVSGDEGEVKKLIREELKGYVESFHVDKIGNLIALKGMEKPGPKVMLNAHMDEIGLIVRRADDKGFLYFKKVGGIDDRVLPGKRVIVGKGVKGVIGVKAIHLQSPEEQGQALSWKSLYIDIGAKTREEAETLAPPGSLVVFDTPFFECKSQFYCGKALDDRLGCALAIELMKKDYPFPLIGLFTVQEEIGLRGASIGAYEYTPDISITLEGTICADVPEVKEHLRVSKLGEGPVITIRDRSVITDEKLRNKLVSVAKRLNIPYQFKQVVAGGTDSSKIQLTRSGVRVLVIAVPARYIHSPVALFYYKDYENTYKLVLEFLKTLKEE